MNILQAIESGAAQLSLAEMRDAARDAKALVRFATGREASFLIAHPEYELSPAEQQAFDDALARRAASVPIQHITGRQEFYGLDFAVSKDVLIPRPETELLVEKAIQFLTSVNGPRFCEIGVGSGCISVSVLKNVPSAAAIGLDISDAALAVARKNAERHEVADRLNLRESDLLAAIGGETFDAILTNPPYISAGDYATLDREVREYEPEIALTDGGDGLEIIRRIVDDSRHNLRSGGVLLLEIGYGQSESVKNMLNDRDWAKVSVFADLQGIPRTVYARRA